MRALRRRRTLAPGILWLHVRARDAMLVESENRAPAETGGVLLGYAGEDGDDLVVVDVLGPGPNAKHLGTRFEPDGPWHAARVAERYASSGRVITYVGDWHSHPTSLPLPSPLDTRSARRIARDAGARLSEPVMLIVGRSSHDSWLVVAFRYRRRRLQPIAMRVFDEH